MRVLLLGLLLLGACKKPGVTVRWTPPGVGTHVIRDRASSPDGTTEHRDLEVLEVADGVTKARVRYDSDGYLVSRDGGKLVVTGLDGATVEDGKATAIADDVRDQMGPPSGLMKILLARAWTGDAAHLGADDTRSFDAGNGSIRLTKHEGTQADFELDLIADVGSGALSATVPITIKLSVDTRSGRLRSYWRRVDLPAGAWSETSDHYTYKDP